ncbi:hypothetical protein NXX61_03180 [Bacteroides ovatus]|nr:hypothetical protein [Bacteroides ovatus]
MTYWRTASSGTGTRKLIRKIRKEVEDFERWTEMKAAEMLRAKRQQK